VLRFSGEHFAFALTAFSPYKKSTNLCSQSPGGLKMATFEDFVLKLMTDPAFASAFLSPNSTKNTRAAALGNMFNPAAIAAMEAVFSSPNFGPNIQALMNQMTTAGAGATLRN
jgi:hypothetical protein